MNSKTASIRVKQLTLTAMTAALICIFSPLSIPIGPVPISLATLAVMFAGAFLGPVRGTASAAVYLLLGMAGLPVFAGFRGGIGVIAGPTGGFLIGYLPLVAICGLGTLFAAQKLWIRAVSWTALCIAGTAVLYAIGTAWFCAVTGSTLTAAIAVCVLPFLPGDALKIAACVILTLSLKQRSTYELF